jgi:hypothetical protein
MDVKHANNNLKPFLERVSFQNTRIEKLERGDILYFGYAGTRQDVIINPCIIFSGVNKTTGHLEGVNMRMFYVDRLINLGTASLAKYGDYYWSEVDNEDEDDSEVVFEKKKVGYQVSTAFAFENLGLYSMAKVTKVEKNKRVQVNLMEKYWRSYDPLKMRLLNDNFSRLSGNNISINIQVANAIIHAAPTQIVTQTRIEA